MVRSWLTCFNLGSHGHKAAGGQTEPKLSDKLSILNVVSPYFLPEKEVGSRKVSLVRCANEVRVWDCGKSKCHPIMGWIGTNVLTRKCADFHVVIHHKRV